MNVTSVLTPTTLTAPVARYYIGVSASDPGGWVVNVTVFANGVPLPGSTVYGGRSCCTARNSAVLSVPLAVCKSV